MILSAQTIRALCRPMNERLYPTVDTKDELIWGKTARRIYQKAPLIDPFVERGVVNGRSFGLGPCSYDVRTADGILLPVGQGRLAVTMERFCLPNNICGTVLDKSTHARLFVSAFNTHLDPGWEGYLTVELVNLGSEAVEWQPGDPLCQIRFDFLDQPTELPYRGKYQSQPQEPVGPINEESQT